MQVVDNVLAQLDEAGSPPVATFIRAAPVGAMGILANVDAGLFDQRKKRLKACSLMRGDVASIVDDDIEPTHLAAHRGEKCRLGLRADPHLGEAPTEPGAGRIDVDPEYDGVVPQIVSPHLQRPAARYADLQKAHLGASEPAEMTVVDIQITAPLANLRPGV